MLLFNATLYAVFYGVTASISTLFSDIYPFLNQTDIGLCFLGIGGGMAIGSVIGGRHWTETMNGSRQSSKMKPGMILIVPTYRRTWQEKRTSLSNMRVSG